MVSVSSMMNEHESGRGVGREGAASWAFLSSLTESAPDEEAYGAINGEEGSIWGGSEGAGAREGMHLDGQFLGDQPQE